MIQLKSEIVNNKIVYQYYKYDMESSQYTICTNYNATTIIDGQTYQPVNGKFEVEISPTTDVSGRVADISTKLIDTNEDLQLLYHNMISDKGWW